MANLFIGININSNTRKSLLSMMSNSMYNVIEFEVESLKILDSNTLTFYDVSMEDVISGNISLVESKIYTLENSGFQQLNVYSYFIFYINKDNKYCCKCIFVNIVAFYKNKYCKFKNSNSKNSNSIMYFGFCDSYRLWINLCTFEVKLKFFEHILYSNYKDYKNLEDDIHCIFTTQLAVEETMKSLVTVGKGYLTFNNFSGVYTLCDLDKTTVINSGIEKVVLNVKGISKKVVVISPSVNDLAVRKVDLGCGILNLRLIIPRKNKSKIMVSIMSSNVYISRNPLYKVEEYLEYSKAFGLEISFY